jgi:hypothetical protein
MWPKQECNPAGQIFNLVVSCLAPRVHGVMWTPVGLYNPTSKTLALAVHMAFSWVDFTPCLQLSLADILHSWQPPTSNLVVTLTDHSFMHCPLRCYL